MLKSNQFDAPEIGVSITRNDAAPLYKAKETRNDYYVAVWLRLAPNTKPNRAKTDRCQRRVRCIAITPLTEYAET
jgi:hypothetical protein